MAILHLVGIIGLNTKAFAAGFERISWVNMLLSFVLILWCHQGGFITKLVMFFVLAFGMGMLAEITGVQSGVIFGSYYYTPVLGARVWGVPLIIGINWAVLAYATGVVLAEFEIPVWARIIAGATLMMLCDFFLENFAIKHHFWVWASGVPPIRNYIGWFGVSLLAHAIYAWLIPNSRNRLVWFYLPILILFLLADRWG